MSAHILGPSDVPRRARLFVPPSYADPPAVTRKCMVPGCGQTFAVDDMAAMQRHAVRCAAEHIDDIRALAPSEANKGTVFDHAGRDKEMEAHFRGVRRRMEREGRKEVLPNETAGFS